MLTKNEEEGSVKRCRFSPLHIHCPIRKIKVKKSYYRFLLVMGGILIYYTHMYYPELEIHTVVVVNTLFALDPTV